MATIHKITAYSINYELEEDIRKKVLSEEEIANIYEQFATEKKVLSKRVKILFIIAAVIALAAGISTYVNTDEAGLAAITSLLILVVFGGAGYLAIYCNIGKISKQWNSLISSYYPKIGDKYRL